MPPPPHSCAPCARREPFARGRFGLRTTRLRARADPFSGVLRFFSQRKVNVDRLDTGSHHPILNQMVYYRRPDLDRTFAALTDQTRRAFVARLSADSAL